MALIHKEDDHNHKWRKGQDAENRQSSKPEKAYPTGKFITQLVIVAKFGGHALCHFTSRLRAKQVWLIKEMTKYLWILHNFGPG